VTEFLAMAVTAQPFDHQLVFHCVS